jgi:SagB-type dehydrogenase family enzyme
MAETSAIAAVRRYHEGSTHHPGRYAPGPGFLDWDNQPEPFRRYDGAPRLRLPLAGEDLAASWDEIHRPGAVPPRRIDRASLGAFFELALGLTAWKEYRGSRWSLRANPSSGNLHPTEGYAIFPEMPGEPAGVYHYVSRDHALERRLTPPSAASLTSALGGGLLFGLSSIHWREAWKYGERAFRYCQQDAGHAIAAVRYAAAVLGWSARLLDAPGDADVARLLGLDREADLGALDPADREDPEALVHIAPGSASATLELDAVLAAVAEGRWAGQPNALSPEHVAWPVIGEVARATRKPRTPPLAGLSQEASDPLRAPDRSASAVRLIRRRRSAVSMDGETSIEAAMFFGMLDRLRPRPGVPPWDVLPWRPRVHPVLFVHRVVGLPPGLYVFERSQEVHASLRATLRPSFRWERPPSCPDALRLFLLEEGDARSFARLAGCHQAIAADSAFSLAMLAELGPALEEGPWWYRWLHWEAGMLGHVLYLEAEAAQVQATGMGCYFDDVVHDVLDLGDDRFRDLYHFTVGGAVEDTRLTTLPGYPDEVRLRPR